MKIENDIIRVSEADLDLKAIAEVIAEVIADKALDCDLGEGDVWFSSDCSLFAYLCVEAKATFEVCGDYEDGYLYSTHLRYVSIYLEDVEFWPTNGETDECLPLSKEAWLTLQKYLDIEAKRF